ncbi:MAG TPA: efflux RND transporter permease subunit, partial [Planctomycetaceae bacterium]|nr:efflux RND transporter permease subunit [Planctomycetaceae bacterium]
MPITVPRASVVEGADDLKARDQILRSFPEVEMVVGKDGRAETPTDPAPLDMIETIVNLHPKEFWPKRHMRFEDAEAQTKVVLKALVDKGFVALPAGADGKSLVDPATMNAITRLDQTLREFVLGRDHEFEAKLAKDLTQSFVVELVARWEKARQLLRPVSQSEIDSITTAFSGIFGARLAAGAAQEDVNRLVQKIAERLSAEGTVKLTPELFRRRRNDLQRVWEDVGELLGAEKPTFFTSLFEFIHRERERRWTGRLFELNREIFDRAVGAYDWYCLEELHRVAHQQGFWAGASTSHATTPTKSPDTSTGQELAKLHALRAELDGPFGKRLLLWTKAKGDIVKEMDSALQIPGWGNIWTQPIINRINMLATGVRTMIGVKVFGKDLGEIQKVSEEIAAVLRKVQGAVDVFPDQNVGKGYVEIKIDRQKAARYGVSVGDIQDVIEVALGGKPITMTVEGRERHPVRIRYARAFRDDEEQIKNLLVSAAGGMAAAAEMGKDPGTGMAAHGSVPPNALAGPAESIPEAGGPRRPLQVPLKMVADVKVVEGPAVIKSENGLLRSYVQLNVRERDIVGFVDEAQRVVAQKVTMPPGMYIEWSGQFEHQIRARNTLKIVFPAVMALIFIILYLTYNDFVDAVLMMMAVPEALVGGIFFLWLRHTNFSVAVWVGFIACFGMATETGIIMLVYLREAIEKRGGLAGIKSLEEL